MMATRQEQRSLLDLKDAANEIGNKSGVPGRAAMWLTSWVFVFASVFLLVEFVLLHSANPPTNELINFFGTIEAVLWLEGFIVLLYWCIYEVPFQFSGTLGCVLKLAASVFFNLQPGSGLVDEDIGIAWSNFVGISLFHGGNMVSVYSMFNMFDSSRPFSEGNLPVWGMWVYTLATTFLVTADGLDYFDVDTPEYIKFGQICGATLLLLGSLIYAYWSRPLSLLPAFSVN